MLLLAAFRNLNRNIRRSLAIAATIAVGSSALMLFKAFNTGIMNQYKANSIHAFYGNGQVNTRGYRDRVFEHPWEHWIADPPAVMAGLRGIPGVSQVFPRLTFFSLLSNGRTTVSGKGMGVDGPAEAAFFTTMNVVQGKMLEAEGDGILMGEGLARSLDLSVGSRVTVLARTVTGSLRSSAFSVTGIFHSGMKDVDDMFFRVQLPRAQKLLGTTAVEFISLGLERNEQWESVARLIIGEFPSLEATPFAVLDKVYYQNSVDWLQAQFGVIQIIILCIVVLGIFNSVSTGILARAEEIGNLRANGESAVDVLLLLVLEVLFLGIIGSAVGVLAGVLIAKGILGNGILMPPAPGITRQFRVRFELQPSHAGITGLMGIGCALVASVLAGIKVARMPIAKALRSV